MVFVRYVKWSPIALRFVFVIWLIKWNTLLLPVTVTPCNWACHTTLIKGGSWLAWASWQTVVETRLLNRSISKTWVPTILERSCCTGLYTLHSNVISFPWWICIFKFNLALFFVLLSWQFRDVSVQYEKIIIIINELRSATCFSVHIEDIVSTKTLH